MLFGGIDWAAEEHAVTVLDDNARYHRTTIEAPPDRVGHRCRSAAGDRAIAERAVPSRRWSHRLALALATMLGSVGIVSSQRRCARGSVVHGGLTAVLRVRSPGVAGDGGSAVDPECLTASRQYHLVDFISGQVHERSKGTSLV